MSDVDNKLDDKFYEFLHLITVLCECYDSKNEEVLALPISTAIRVLLHDTKNSTSLLTHLNKSKENFFSTNLKDSRECVHLGLVRRVNIGVKDGVGGEAKYLPLCYGKYFSTEEQGKYLSFNEWWEKEGIFVNEQSTLTRKDLVLNVTNKDGGAHFDKKVKKNYDAFRHSWSGGSCLSGINSGIKRGYDNIPIYPAIRQIGYELLRTLKD
ncbi:hypothetical protein KIH87_05465 [Paraneptunicella aestuarii]|uniref:hypothetical protein n=1 Tax=Paraneptunicella aestuarii TaxID=2831148 RepID=UPI001E58BB26|nr:hypothetical protein [Paraneptunicella aestuarii]UAA39804.1 hypothetical protein KIH87_05465 [Paraneptunicella aestuarii]